MGKMKIVIGNDHGGVDIKNKIMEKLAAEGNEIINIGTDTEDIVRYPYYAECVAKTVAKGEADRGILICSTGIGMSIVANKFPGVRAALCTDTYMAKMTRRHNDSNILCLAGQLTGPLEAYDIVEAWLTNEFEGGRHNISLQLISEVENRLFQKELPEGSAMTQGL